MSAKSVTTSAATGEGCEPSGALGTWPESVRPVERGAPEARRSGWRRLLLKKFDVPPLLCPKCRAEMKLVASVTARATIDRVLDHREAAGLVSPFEPRGPPLSG